MFGKVFIVLLSCVVLLVAGTSYCPPDTTGTATVPCVLIPGCNFDNGTLTPLATQCSNQLSDSDCQNLFPCPTTASTINGVSVTCTRPGTGTTTATDYPFVRSPLCNSPTLQNIALQCAQTCALCCQAPQFNCDDDTNSPIDCVLNNGKCKDANWTTIMSQYCPKTCGLCGSGACSDANSGCNTMTSLCKNVDWIDYMRTKCARTCDYCTTSGGSNSSCTNIAPNCAQNANLCTDPTYRTLMQQQCCATCGGTNGNTGGIGSPSVSCTDTDPSCSSWVRNGFCTSTFYTSDQKRQYCGRSCNLC